jgi:hypothetical protein
MVWLVLGGALQQRVVPWSRRLSMLLTSSQERQKGGGKLGRCYSRWSSELISLFLGQPSRKSSMATFSLEYCRKPRLESLWISSKEE